MDLTSLSSNLPHNNPAHPEDSPEDEEPASTLLMSAFKQAAYSVTALYKMAGEQVERSRREGQKEGYQECLDDLFALLQRLEGKTDPAARETVRQWALGRRRKLGPRSAMREEREPSTDSEVVDHHGSSSPMQESQEQHEPSQPQQQQQQQQQQSTQPMNTTPQSSPAAPYLPSALPQLPTFSFQAPHHMPRHVAVPPDTSDIELPDNDSPPPSPRIPPNPFQHNTFQHTKSFGHANRARDRHARPRAGAKRRIDAISDFFDLAGMEKMEKMKKGRFQ